MKPAICEPLGLICIYPEDSPKKPHPVPLTGVRVSVKIVDLVAEVEVVQKYVNKETNPIEAVYKFPLDEGAAVFHFSAIVENREIIGQVKEIEEAQKTYNEAITSGKTAFLLEETLPDVFKAKIGNLPPGAGASVTIKYVLELPVVEDGKVRFSLPTTIAPRYIPTTDVSEAAKDLANISYTLESKYKMEFTAEIAMASSITNIESPSHELGKQIQGRTASIHTLQEKVRMNEDLVIVVTVKEPHKPRVTIERSDEGTHAAMVSLVPSFKLKEQQAELIFVVDRSGSMQGESIAQAREALLIFLHSLPMDCYFNIVGFGSSFESLFPTSSKYDDNSLQAGKAHVERLDANLGGTELFAPLNHILNLPPIEGYLRQIFVLTDGEVSNTDQVISLVRRCSHQSRVFALGLGRSASHHLVGGIARLGGGTAVYATVEEKLDKKVLGQLKDALHPAISDVKVSWKGLEEPATPVVVQSEKTLLGFGKPIVPEKREQHLYRQAPSKVPPVFDGSRFIVYALLTKEAKLPTGVTVTAVTPDGPLSVDLELSELKLSTSKMIHRLAAKKLIQELVYMADEQLHKRDVIELGVKYNLASKFTAFVAVDPKENKNVEGQWAAVQTREIPLHLAHGWHGVGGSQMFGMQSRGMAMPVAMMCRSAPPPVAMMCDAATMMPLGMTIRGGSSSGGGAMMVGGAPPPTQMRRMAKCADSVSFGFSGSSESDSDLLEAASSGLAPQYLNEMSTPELPSKPAVSKLVQLIQLQKFDGSFVLDLTLCEVVGVKLEDAEKRAKDSGVDDKMMATALAVAYFENKLQADKESWELVVTKARKFMQKNSKISVDDLVKELSAMIEQ